MTDVLLIGGAHLEGEAGPDQPHASDE